MGFGLNRTYERLLTMCRVVDFEGNKTLAWPEKLQYEILSLFETRYRLHKQVYNHHTVKAGEYIINDILNHILKEDDLSFSILNDSLILFPLNETIINLKQMFDKRELPKLVGEKVICFNLPTQKIKNFEIKLDNIITQLNNTGITNKGWSKIKIGFISGKGENPLKKVVYFKNSLQHPHQLKEYNSFMAPKTCQEYIYRIYSDTDYKLDYARSLWKKIIEDNE